MNKGKNKKRPAKAKVTGAVSKKEMEARKEALYKEINLNKINIDRSVFEKTAEDVKKLKKLKKVAKLINPDAKFLGLKSLRLALKINNK